MERSTRLNYNKIEDIGNFTIINGSKLSQAKIQK